MLKVKLLALAALHTDGRGDGGEYGDDEIDDLLTDTGRVHKKGSGVGLVNVNNRIQILFGKEYGLKIESELDEGTTVSICMPAELFSEERQKYFEKGQQMIREHETDRRVEE